MNILRNAANALVRPVRNIFLNRKVKQMRTAIENRSLDNFLELLLGGMQLLFAVNPAFRENIRDFNARYCFKSRDGKIAASAVFKNDRMTMKRSAIGNTSITVVFDSGKTLWEFLFSDDPNVFDFILENRLGYTGNLNYMLKFGYMAKHVRLQFGV
jgi:hypothetical protein